LQGGTGKAPKNVVFATKMRQFNISFLTVVYLKWSGRRPSSVANLFGGWLNGIPKQFKNLILVGAAALCWSVWLCRNVAVFENKKFLFFAGTL